MEFHSTPPFEPLHKLSHTRAVMLFRGTLRIPKHFLCWRMLNLQAHKLMLLQKNDKGPVGMHNSDRTKEFEGMFIWLGNILAF